MKIKLYILVIIFVTFSCSSDTEAIKDFHFDDNSFMNIVEKQICAKNKCCEQRVVYKISKISGDKLLKSKKGKCMTDNIVSESIYWLVKSNYYLNPNDLPVEFLYLIMDSENNVLNIGDSRSDNCSIDLTLRDIGGLGTRGCIYKAEDRNIF